MNRKLLCLLLLLTGCGSGVPVGSPPDLSPHSVAWALIPGAWQEYQIFRGKGQFDPSTGCLTPDETSLVPGEINRNTNLAYLDGIARVYSPGGVQVTAVPAQLGASLLEKSDSSGRYLGEAGSYLGPSLTPPEPMVTKEPLAGERLFVSSIATNWDGTTFPFQSQYYTKQAGPTVIGCLVENPSGQMTAYTMEYDGELLSQTYGLVQADGTVQVIVARRVREGENE